MTSGVRQDSACTILIDQSFVETRALPPGFYYARRCRFSLCAESPPIDVLESSNPHVAS